MRQTRLGLYGGNTYNKRQLVLSDFHKKTLLEIFEQVGSHAKNRERLRAKVLLLLDEGLSYDQVSQKCSVSRQTVYNIKRKYKNSGSYLCVYDSPDLGRTKKITKKAEELILHKIDDPTFIGTRQRRLVLLARELEASGICIVTPETIRNFLKKKNLYIDFGKQKAA